jgi:chemotaxis protein methyltransferase CheR
VTVQETRFFRDPVHFDVLARAVLPTLPRAGLVWSAGCANGQEAWSLAMALAEAGADHWGVMASDIAEPALARTRAAVYTEAELAGLSPARRERFMRRRPDGRWEIVPSLRGRVRTVAHNLLDAEPPVPPESCRVVFCRNVLIYFDHAATVQALAMLRRAMPPRGWLFVGGAEIVNARSHDFVAERHGAAFVYRPRGRPGERPAAPAPAAPAAPARRSRPRSRPPEPAAVVLPSVPALLQDGEQHAAAGRFHEAAVAFRRAVYLDPDDWSAHLRLGLALERAPGGAGAERAFRAARAALGRAPDAEHDGWSRAVVERLLASRLGC